MKTERPALPAMLAAAATLAPSAASAAAKFLKAPTPAADFSGLARDILMAAPVASYAVAVLSLAALAAFVARQF